VFKDGHLGKLQQYVHAQQMMACFLLVEFLFSFIEAQRLSLPSQDTAKLQFPCYFTCRMHTSTPHVGHFSSFTHLKVCG